MKEKVLRSLLVEGHNLDMIAKNNAITKDEVIKILDEYSISQSNRGLLAELYKENTELINKNINAIIQRISKNNIIIHYRVLKLFLVHGYSKRGICRMVKEIKDESGCKSQRITNKYNLTNNHRGCLFLHTKKEYESIIRSILINKSINEDKLKVKFDRFTEKYRGLIIHLVTGGSIDNLHNVLNGELRNLIQRAFKPLKLDIGICQYDGCGCKKNIENAHSGEKGQSRPEIFKTCIDELEDKSEINVEEIMKSFLIKHQNNSDRRKKLPPILYLCKEHHLEYDRLSKENKKEKDIKAYNEFINHLMI